MIQKLFPSRGFSVPTPTAEVKDSPLPDTKSSVGLLPVGAYGMNYTFFSSDGGRTIIDIADGGHVAYAFLAYWYVATRWRAQKIAEAPLMVVEEDQENGSEEWLNDHELIGILEEPSPDYDMGELLETTSHYLDNTSAALWVLDRDRIGRVARITPFSRDEFEPMPDGKRLYASFMVRTSEGSREFDAEEVCYFRDAHSVTPLAWGRGRSRLQVALNWLKLGAKAQSTIQDLLGNSMWPSAVMVPDKDWDPDPATFQQYKQDLEQYARQGNRGKPFVALGGGQFTPLSTSIKDLVPTDILNRVESVVAAVSGVPAIVLQFQVGMENSPWSQMAQARRMAYDDTVVPSWRKIERVLTRQLLRPIDEDPTRFIRFDRSNIDSLQRDQLESVQIATTMGTAASLNERRGIMGLEPLDDEKADEVPELTQPSMAELLAGRDPNADPNADDPNADDPNADDTTDDSGDKPVDPKEKDPKKDPKKKAKRERKFKAAALIDSFRTSAIPLWQVTVGTQLHKDATAIAELVQGLLGEPEGKSLQSKARGKDRAMDAVTRYLAGEGKKGWTRAVTPVATQSATRAGAVTAADMEINYQLLHPNLIKFAQRETAKLITGVNKTTKEMVSNIIQGGIEEGASSNAIARLISDATGFSSSRAKLIARTETTKIFSGAPEESLTAYGKSSGRVFTKEWSTAGDEKVRDEHADMEGETVPVGEEFSNGLLYPSEPNCRCSVLYDEQED